MREKSRNNWQEENKHSKGDFAVAGDGHVGGVMGEVRCLHHPIVVIEAHYREATRSGID